MLQVANIRMYYFSVSSCYSRCTWKASKVHINCLVSTRLVYFGEITVPSERYLSDNSLCTPLRLLGLLHSVDSKKSTLLWSKDRTKLPTV